MAYDVGLAPLGRQVACDGTALALIRGSTVALRFLTPGEYACTIDHHAHLTGTIVVQK